MANPAIGLLPAELPPLEPLRGVLTVVGHAVRLSVERGHLVVEDGAGRTRRRAVFPRIASGIRRVVVMGQSGALTLEAMRWLYELKIPFVQLGGDGEIIASSAPAQLRDAHVRRAQGGAIHTGAGLAIGRELVRSKLIGQQRVFDRLPASQNERAEFARAIELVDEADSLDRIRFIEARAAALYWRAWEQLPIRFAGRDAKLLPRHWHTFGQRRSHLSPGPRKATTPGNALVNYLYAVLEAETRIALLAVGCDPQLGVLHADRQGRESLVFDAMEPVRPYVDDYVLGLIQSTVFQRSDFFERHDGNCRLMPALTQPLAQTALRWRKLVAPIAENIADAFVRADRAVSPNHAPKEIPASTRPIRTPLTGGNRSRTASGAQRVARLALSSAAASLNRCADCGLDMGKRRRKYCDDCLPQHAARASARGVEVQRQLQRIGADRRSDKDVRDRHRIAAQKAAEAQQRWEAANDVVPSRATFGREFGEALRAVSIDSMRAATGLSYAFCRNVRLGKSTPHPRHWEALRDLVAKTPVGARLDVAKPKRQDWQRRIAPHLPVLGAAGIQRATGLSASYARRILHGHHVPRPEHWPALLAAITENG